MNNQELADLFEEAARRLRRPAAGKSQTAKMSLPALLTVTEQAQVLAITPRHLQNLMARKAIPYIKLGRSVRFNPEAVSRAVEKLTVHECGHKKEPTRRSPR